MSAGRALVLGSAGTLGHALAEALPGAGWTLVGALDRAACDVTRPEAVQEVVARLRPTAIFNAAAFTDVDGAEDRPEACWQANTIAPEILAVVAARANIALVHYSTDFVFDGEQGRPYDEFDPPVPRGEYARSKLAGERLAAAAARAVFVVRVGCLYGRGGRNFPSSIARRLLAGETVRADAGRLGSPTWVRDVARVSAALAQTKHYGLYHCTAQGETTWADFAAFVAAELGVPAARVQAVDTASLPLKAPRPRRAVLDNRMLRLRGLDTMPGWQEAARGFLAEEGAVARAP